jgi:hypothetical protein
MWQFTYTVLSLHAHAHTYTHLIITVAPVKALCSERLEDWISKFSSLGLKCKEYTGDTDECDLASLSTYHLVLTTPEKWDSITRKWKDNKGIVQMVKLFLIDEVGHYDILLSSPPPPPPLSCVSFPLALLLNQRCTPPLRLQFSDCSTFLVMGNIHSTVFFFF